MGILEKLLYKKDANSPNGLRISKTKVITWIVFVLGFLYSVGVALSSPIFMNTGTIIFISLMTGLIYAAIVFVIGYVIGYILDRRN